MENITLVNVASKATADAHYANVTDAHDLVNRLAGKISGGAAAGGELSGTYPNPAVLNSAILAKVLTGLNVVGSSIAATDNLLQAFGKLQNQLNGVLGGAIYQGVWNATTNSPALASGAGTKGFYYVVSVAGATNLDGVTDWKIGDWAIFNGTVWEKVDNTDAVSSVNGFVGAVNLTTADIPEVTNLYYTLTNFLTTTLSGFSVGANTPIADGISFATMLARIQGQITARPNESATTIATITNSTASKTTPVNADEVVGMDSANSFVLIKYSWTNIKAFLKTYFDTLFEPLQFVEIKTASNSTSIFFNNMGAGYDYEFWCSNIIPVTDGTSWQIRTSSDNGASYASGAGNYRNSRGTVGDNGTVGGVGSTSATSIILAGGLGTATGETFDGVIRLINPGEAQYCKVWCDFAYVLLTPEYATGISGGVRLAQAAVNAVQFTMVSGNIASGTIIMRRKKRT